MQRGLPPCPAAMGRLPRSTAPCTPGPLSQAAPQLQRRHPGDRGGCPGGRALGPADHRRHARRPADGRSSARVRPGWASPGWSRPACVKDGADATAIRGSQAMLDSQGLVFNRQDDRDPYKREFSWSRDDLDPYGFEGDGPFYLLDVVSHVKPTVLIGTRATPASSARP